MENYVFLDKVKNYINSMGIKRRPYTRSIQRKVRNLQKDMIFYEHPIINI